MIYYYYDYVIIYYGYHLSHEWNPSLNAQDIKSKIKTLRKSSEREQQKYKLPIVQNYDKCGQLTKVFGRLVDV